jgi:hypothetical protein
MPAGDTKAAQIIMDLAIAIDRSALKPALLDLASDGLVFFTTEGQGIDAPGIKTTGVNIENLAYQSDRVLL